MEQEGGWFERNSKDKVESRLRHCLQGPIEKRQPGSFRLLTHSHKEESKWAGKIQERKSVTKAQENSCHLKFKEDLKEKYI